MPPEKFTRTQLRVTDMYESDDTLQVAASTAEHTTPTVLLEAGNDHDGDEDLYDDLRGQRDNDSLIDNDSGDLRSPIADDDCIDVATQHRLMLEMVLENQDQWRAKQGLEMETMVAERERMAGQWDQWAAESAEHTE